MSENNESPKVKKLDYGDEFQRKVIANLLFDEQFLQNNFKIIKPIYFESHKYHWIVDVIINHYQRYSTTPSLESFFVYLKKDSTLEQKQKENIVKMLALMFNKKEHRVKLLKDREHIQEHTSEFCWQENMINALYEASKKAKEGKFEEILPTIEIASKAGNEISQAVDYDDVEDRINTEFREGIVPLPWDAVNARIGGGIGKKEFMVLVGGMGSGKSLIASNIGLHARKSGVTAVIYSLELSKQYFRHRTDVVLTGSSSDYLEDLKKNNVEKYRAFLKEKIKDFPENGRLKIQTLPAGSTAIDIKNDIKWLQAQGYDIDLFIIDYLDRMDPINGKRGKQSWDNFEDITNECRDDIAFDLNIAGFGLIQGNTSSLENNMMKAGSTSGGAKRLHPADVVFGYARNSEAKNENRANFTIIKNRFGKDAISLPVITDYEIGKIDILDDEHAMVEMEENSKEETKRKIIQRFSEFEQEEEMKNLEYEEL